MPRRNWKSLSTDEILNRIRRAGISESNRLASDVDEQDKEIPDLNTRLKQLLSLADNINRKPTDMIYLVMYDIESNKVRNLVAKYLISQGCIRIQNSIFIADTTPEQCKSIKHDLAEVQASYDNNDSIIVVPLTMTNVGAMHIIGKSIDLNLVIKKQSAMFF